MITIEGRSDDLIEIAGEISNELNYTQDGIVALSNGVLLSVAYDGNWRLQILHDPNKLAVLTPLAHRDESFYSDLVYIEGKVNWVVYAPNANLVRK